MKSGFLRLELREPLKVFSKFCFQLIILKGENGSYHFKPDENNRKFLEPNGAQFLRLQRVVWLSLAEYSQLSENVLVAAFVDDVLSQEFHLNAIASIYHCEARNFI